MPNISVLKNSKFLKKEDCNPPILLTITDCTEENISKEGAAEEFKWCLHFSEVDKPLVLNSTCGQIIAGFTGKDNTDDWVGVKVVLFHDPNVSFGGKLIGGIRVRAPRNQPAKSNGPAPTRPVTADVPSPKPRPATPAAVPADETGEIDPDEVPF